MASLLAAHHSRGKRIGKNTTLRQSSSAILPLPAEVVAQIESSTAITSLSGVVVELLKNSLDASATKVEVTVDFGRGGCVVEDNGLGIAPQEFREEGGLSKMYCTSRYNSEDATFGRNGTFLASLAAMSLMTITSHHYEHRSHNTVSLHHCKPIARQIPAPPQQEISFREHGTRVTVRDLFGNMPVRVKHRAMVLEDKSEHERLWESLRKAVTGVLLGWRTSVSIRLRDIDKNRSLFLNGQKTAALVGKEELERTSYSSELRYMLNILAQASYVSFDEWGSWVPASASTTSISIDGAISLNPAPSKRVQFLSLGIRPLSSEEGHNELYDEINRIFSLSSFGTVEDDSDVDEDEKERRKYDKRFKSDGFTNREIKGGRKGIDRWPMFCLRISLKDLSASEGALLNDKSQIQSVLEVLTAMVTQWLSVHNFCPRTRKVKFGRLENAFESLSEADEESPSTPRVRKDSTRINAEPRSQSALALKTMRIDSTIRKRKRSTLSRPASATYGKVKSSTLRQTQPFMEWSRIKSGNVGFYDSIWNTGKTVAKSAGKSAETFEGSNEYNTQQRTEISLPHSTFNAGPILPGSLGKHTKTTKVPNTLRSATTSDAAATFLENGNPTEPNENSHDEAIAWTNPVTKQTFLVNSRTGCVLSRPSNRPNSNSDIPTRYASTLSDITRSLRIRQNSRPVTADITASPWLKGLLRDWDNPVFKVSENRIPQVFLEGPNTEIADIKRTGHRNCSRVDIDKAFEEVSVCTSSRLSRHALHNAKVIAQVDKKFILVKLSGSPETIAQSPLDKEFLVLIDQHAADERIRIEALLSELCAPTSNSPDYPKFRSSLGQESRINHKVLVTPLQFVISAQESSLFRTHATRFAAWGILYNITDSAPPDHPITTGKPNRSSIEVTTLPPSITERCKSDPKLLISLLRTEIWKVAERPTRARQNPEPDSTANFEHPWLRHIGSCPQGLLDLLNSRACRSAIMFNDALGVGECEELVRKLAGCAFPFQCAHGRPSMVPLVELGTGGNENGEGRERVGFGYGESVDGGEVIGGGKEGCEGGYVDAWKRWRGRENGG
ncbi:hypothetical protein K432DRAFT_304291 [Lepidopterella palustris CBS 459.81]|uniref:MutL C-terminal dimerisation domain-containing protein n=1 Tax=Lepidopterella palustris CBS 459.81 TaxID=1314670 RepID=A0A8E2E574_9PEZI|nr:hypothetical protein K432DRAFT_304291 [Lepidopterella palustris CBS 459.81]